MEYRNFFENLKFINIVNFFCEDRLKGGTSRPHSSHAAHIFVITNFFSLERIFVQLRLFWLNIIYLEHLID